MQAARWGSRLLRTGWNLKRGGGRSVALGSVAHVRAFAATPAYASPPAFLEKEEVEDRVTTLLKSSLLVDPAKVTPTAIFEKDLQLDMLDHVEVMMVVEEEFALDIPNSEADNISTVSQLIDFIATHPHAK